MLSCLPKSPDDQESETWEKNDIFEGGLTASIKITGKVGVPLLGSSEVEVGATGFTKWSKSKGWGKTSVEKKAIRDTYTTTIPARSRADASLTVSLREIDVAFIAQVELTLRDGSLFEYKMYGQHRSASVSSSAWDLKVTEL